MQDILVDGSSSPSLFIEENSIGVSLGVVGVIEEDIGQTVTFHVENTADFKIQNNNLVVRTGEQLMALL